LFDSKLKKREGLFREEAIRKAFNTFELDQNGYIGVAELKRILIMMGEQVSDQEAPCLMMGRGKLAIR
jgi:Ca2+-binding EF-hand superfamily protein